MEKLELKHLAPYLPFNIKVQWLRTEDNSYQISEFNFSDACWLFRRSEFKPILRPIDDLYNEKTDFGIKIVHYFNFKTNVKLDCRNFPYHVMEQLFKKHFDVFGLIPKGLATSYSDVQSTSNEG